MAHGPIPVGELIREVRRLGFEPTPAQIRFLEKDFAEDLNRFGEQLGTRMQVGAHALRKAGNEYGKALMADIHALQKAAAQ